MLGEPLLAAEEECHDLGAGTGFVRGEVRRVDTAGDAALHGPEHSVLVPGALADVLEAHCAVLRAAAAVHTPEHRHDRGAGDGLVRGEGGLGNALRDAGLRGPAHRVIEVLVRGDVGEGDLLLLRFGAAGKPPEEGHDLGAGAAAVRGEEGARRAGGDPELHGPEDGLGEPLPFRYVVKRVLEGELGIDGHPAGLVGQLRPLGDVQIPRRLDQVFLHGQRLAVEGRGIEDEAEVEAQSRARGLAGGALDDQVLAALPDAFAGLGVHEDAADRVAVAGDELLGLDAVVDHGRLLAGDLVRAVLAGRLAGGDLRPLMPDLDQQLASFGKLGGPEGRGLEAVRRRDAVFELCGRVVGQDGLRAGGALLGDEDPGRRVFAGAELGETPAALGQAENVVCGAAGVIRAGLLDLAGGRGHAVARGGGRGRGELVTVGVLGEVARVDGDLRLAAALAAQLHEVFAVLDGVDRDRLALREDEAGGLRDRDLDRGLLLEQEHRHQDLAVGDAVAVDLADRLRGPGLGGAAGVRVGDGDRDVGEVVAALSGEPQAQEGRRGDHPVEQRRLDRGQVHIEGLDLRAADRSRVQDILRAVVFAEIDRGVGQHALRLEDAVHDRAVLEHQDRAGLGVLDQVLHLLLGAAARGVHVGRPARAGAGQVDAGAAVVAGDVGRTLRAVGHAQAAQRDRHRAGLAVVPVVADVQLGEILDAGQVVEIDVGGHRGTDDAALDRVALLGERRGLLPVGGQLHDCARAALIGDARAGRAAAEGRGGGGIALVVQAVGAAGGFDRGHADQAVLHVRLRPGGDRLAVVLRRVGVQLPVVLVQTQALPVAVDVILVPAGLVRVEEQAAVVQGLHRVAGALEGVKPDAVLQRPVGNGHPGVGGRLDAIDAVVPGGVVLDEGAVFRVDRHDELAVDGADRGLPAFGKARRRRHAGQKRSTQQ